MTLLADANVIVAAILGDVDSHGPLVAELIRKVEARGEKLLVTEGVLAEAVWVLGRRYAMDPTEIASALVALLDSSVLRSASRGRRTSDRDRGPATRHRRCLAGCSLTCRRGECGDSRPAARPVSRQLRCQLARSAFVSTPFPPRTSRVIYSPARHNGVPNRRDEQCRSPSLEREG